GGEGVVARDRRVVDRGDRDADGGDVTVEGAVVGLVGERIGAVVVGGGRVGETAVRIQRQRAVRRAAYQDGRQGRPVHVAIVAEHARRGDGQRRVLAGGAGVVARDRRVVDRG